MGIVLGARSGAFVGDAVGWRQVFSEPCTAVAADESGAVWFGEKNALLVSDKEARAFSPPPGVCRALLLRDALCALSADGDGVYRLSRRTGAPLCFSPAGCFPRDLDVSPCGRFLAVAGGAGGEVAVFETPSLEKLFLLRLPGVAVGVRFLKGTLYALCAAERGDAAALYALAGGGRLIRSFDAAPCALGTLRGRLLVGLNGLLIATGRDGVARRAYPCGLPARITETPEGALCCDAQEGLLLIATGRIGALPGAPEEPADAAAFV